METRRLRNSGFSVIEFGVAVCLGFLFALAVPGVEPAKTDTWLRDSISSVADLLHSCRVAAAEQNTTKTSRFRPLTIGLIVYVKNAADESGPAPTDSQVELQAAILTMPSPDGVGAPAPLKVADLGFTPQSGDASFNSQGLPCRYQKGVCTQSGFAYYFKNARHSEPDSWAAISISPEGRIRRWFWTGSAWSN